MVRLMWPELHNECAASGPKMFDGSRRLKQIWDGVRLEVTGDAGSVVLNSFTQLDPDLPLTESAAQEIGEETEDGAIYTITLRRVQVHQAASKGQRWLGVDSEPAMNLYETCKVRTIKAGTLEKLVEYLVSAFKGNDSTYVTIFLCTYRAFASTKQVLDLLLNRYGNLHQMNGDVSKLTPDDRLELKKTISSILGAWLDQYSEDFRKPPDYSCLKHLHAYIRQMFPESDLQRRAQTLLGTFQRHKGAEPDQDASDHSNCTYTLVEENGFEDEKPDFLSFIASVVAEQFTLMDAELSEIFSDDNNHSLSRELLIKEGTSKFATLDINPKRAQKRQQQQKEMGVMQGTIPYLGTFLTDLVMLDTAVKDHLDGGLINFEKRRKVCDLTAWFIIKQSVPKYSIRQNINPV
ncbi:hypothetical protein chiPu_0019864 [Chiloscyllium punctatum]|uniref:N-terminal Ras-GEF domain-containing protein n=1 Tax=Chiloscyllium punctatum TaxID=137246 RepID=A0A401RTD1_CHIPU|nr:hypothetical protein [Chiloscyllium punctatum]